MKEIGLTRGKVTFVDDEDYENLCRWKWHIVIGNGGVARAATKINGRQTLMHRYLLNVTDKNILVDHKDRDSLNNQKSNLRKSTISQNSANRTKVRNSTSKYLGVYLDKTKWRSSLKKNQKTIHLGTYFSETDAAKAYNEAAIIHHGEFANLNLF